MMLMLLMLMMMAERIQQTQMHAPPDVVACCQHVYICSTSASMHICVSQLQRLGHRPAAPTPSPSRILK